MISYYCKNCNIKVEHSECPVCGHVSKDNRDKHSHVFECEDCGFRSNDDRSAAMVLLGRGREKVLAELVEQGSSQPGFSQ